MAAVAVIVHGYNVTADHAWYRPLGQLLESDAEEVYIPNFPGGQFPQAHLWLELLHQMVGQYAGRTITLIGHSLGARAVMLYLSRFETVVDTMVLVGPCPNSLDAGLRHSGHEKSFFDRILPMEPIIDRALHRLVIHSQDDPVIPYAEGVSLARDLSAQLETFNGLGHFQEARQAPLLSNTIRQYRKR
jgi:predicted alpha/beta hydrolase family esterase